MAWLRRSSRIGFVIAGIAAIIFVAGTANLVTISADLDTMTAKSKTNTADNTGVALGEELQKQARIEEARRSHVTSQVQELSLTVLISGVTCLVSTVGAFSTMLLAWRLDRRQTKEAELRFSLMQIDMERSRQVSQFKVDQS